MNELNLMALSYRNLQPQYTAVFLPVHSWREGAATHLKSPPGGNVSRVMKVKQEAQNVGLMQLAL